MESGLDWFHSISPSLSSDDMNSPIVTSTQANSSHSETSTVIQQANVSVSNNLGTLRNSKDDVNKIVKEKSSVAQEELKQMEKQRDKSSPEVLDCVFQKVSKNLRDRRLRELEGNDQQWDKGEGAAVRVDMGGNPRNNLNDLDKTSDSVLSGKSPASPTSTHLSSGKPEESRRLQTGTKKISSVLREKMAAEAETDLHAKFSGFVFKPRKMKPSVQDSGASAEKDHNSHTEISKRQVPHDLTSLLGDENKNKRKETQNQQPTLSESEVRATGGDEGLLTHVKTVDRARQTDDTEILCQQTAFGDEDVTCSSALNSNTCMGDPTPSKPKSTVASATLAKLSRFSFTCTAESNSTAQIGLKKESPLKADAGQCSRANSDVRRTLMDKVNDALPPTVTKLTPRLEHGQRNKSESEAKCPARLTESTDALNQSNSVQMVNGGSSNCLSFINLRKRKCFELVPAPSRVGSFSGLSLFGSDELSNDVFDTDWDQEVSKKAKV